MMVSVKVGDMEVNLNKSEKHEINYETHDPYLDYAFEKQSSLGWVLC